MPERPPKSAGNLTDHINELESLIAAGKTPRTPGARVPILDDVVEPGEAAAPGTGADGLEERLLRRVDSELADLAVAIREVIRRCIREELASATRDDTPAADRSESAD